MSNKNIDLGTFQWDTNKIEHQIAANSLEMGKFSAIVQSSKKQIQEQGKAISELEKKIESERKAQERLNQQLDKGYISQEQYNSEVSKSNQLIDEYVDEQIQASKAQADHIIIQNRAQQSTKELRLENNELNKLLGAGRVELSQNESAYRDLNGELNALKIEAKNLGAQMLVLERAGKENTDEYKLLSAQFTETSAKADKLNDDFKKIDKSVGDNSRTVGDYKDQIKEAASEITIGFNQILNGNLQEGMKSLQAGLGGVTSNVKALWASLLANPLTLVLVAITAITAGIALGAKEIFDYNASIKENIKLVENLTSTTGKAADEIRNRATGLSKTFGDEFNEVVKTANVLAKQLGISYEEAFSQIENGYVRGANANGDFLERLREYGPLLAKYGFDINEIIGLQVQAQQQGIFNDKFEDSLKEAGLSLEEFTKAQSDALTSAFGAEFSDKISKGVNSGALSVKDALLLMSSEAKKQGLSVQQFGILTADVFKGAGEDAGGAQAMFENLYAGMQKASEPLTELQKKTQALSQANFELATAKDEALKSDAVQSFSASIELMWVKVQTVFYGIVGGFKDIIVWLDETTGASDSLGETWEIVSEYASSLWDLITQLVDVFGDLFKALGFNNNETKSLTKSFFNAINPLNVLKALFGVLTVAVKSFSSFVEQNRINISAFAITVKSVFGQIVDAAKAFTDLDFEGGLNKLKNINISKEFASARKEAEKIAALNKQQSVVAEKTTPEKVLNNGKTQAEKDAEAKALAEAQKKADSDRKSAQTKRIADAKKTADDAQKALEAEAKRALEIAKEQASQSVEIAKNELAEYVALNAEKYKNDKTLSQKKLQDQLAYFDEVKKLQTQANNAEESAKQFAIDQKIQEIEAKKNLNTNDLAEIKNLNLEKENIAKEYYIKDIELTQSTEEQKATIQKNYDALVSEQKKLRQSLEFQQRLLDLEARGASEFEIQKAQLENETQLKLDKFWEENEILSEADQEKYDLDQEIAIGRAELEAEIQLAKDENEKMRLQNLLDTLNQIEKTAANNSIAIENAVNEAKLQGKVKVLQGVSQLFGQETKMGKAVAVAAVLFEKYKAISSVISNTALANAAAVASSPMTAGMPWVAVNTTKSVIDIAGLVGSAAASIGSITGIKGLENVGAGIATVSSGIKQVKGYATSGLVDGGFEISRSNGDNRLVTVKDGEVILNETHQQMLGGADIFRMIGVPGFATSGVVGTPPSRLATVQNSMNVPQQNIVLDENAIAQITSAIYAGSQSGISDLSNNRQIASNANF